MIEKVLVPDIGEAQDVEVVEVLVAVGDSIAADDSIVVLESDKASMEIPAPCAGTVSSIGVSEGDQVEEGSLILEIETEAGTEAPGSETTTEASEQPEPAKTQPIADIKETDPQNSAVDDGTSNAPKIEKSQIVSVPDVGDAAEVVVVEVLVQRGEQVDEATSVVVLESDKASMEIPADMPGVVQEIFVNEGDEVKEGDPLVTLIGKVDAEVAKAAEDIQESDVQRGRLQAAESKDAAAKQPDRTPQLAPAPEVTRPPTPSASVHAGPAVRRQAREYGVDLGAVTGTGRKGRLLKEDIQTYIKQRLSGAATAGGGSAAGIPDIPEIDFTKWGEVEDKPLSRIRKASARNLHRSWLNVPHVTQFDEADITELEAFRKSQNTELANQGKKLTPLAFLVKAVVATLQTYPQFNASIQKDYDHLIIKKYYNMGIAVETDDGLVVPVLKDADKKGVIQLAEECAELAAQARDKKLPMDAMQGATFTISSLGGIGGTAFTPIVNAPEVAILGVSRSKVSPQWDGEQFLPRTMLPLSLSYDHRAIDGAEAARFTSHLAQVLADIRRTIL